MLRRCRFEKVLSMTVVLLLGLATSADIRLFAQANSPTLPQVFVSIPPAVRLETLHLVYVLYGPFGANGGYIVPKPNVTEYRFTAGVKEAAATEVRGVLYADGCKTQTFKLAITALSQHVNFNCETLPTVLMTGKVDGFETYQGKELNVEIAYLARWLCDFFGFADCMVTTFKIADIAPHCDGSFEIRLPDFTLDSNHSSAGNRYLGEFQVILRERRTGYIVAFLRPSDGPGEHNLAVQEDYPTLVHFVNGP